MSLDLKQQILRISAFCNYVIISLTYPYIFTCLKNEMYSPNRKSVASIFYKNISKSYLIFYTLYIYVYDNQIQQFSAPQINF